MIASGTRVLMFGDSMVNAGLAARMEQLVTARGATFASDSWASSTTRIWSTSKRLPTLLASEKPDVVFITIGSNEVYWLDPDAGSNVRKIVAKLEGLPCVLVGPPVWKGETGVVAAERDNAAPCAFFDSGALTLERQSDGIHPDAAGGAEWAVALFRATVAPE